MKTYEQNVTQETLAQYAEFSQSHNEDSVHVWYLVIAVFLLVINIVGKEIKNDYIEEY